MCKFGVARLCLSQLMCYCKLPQCGAGSAYYPSGRLQNVNLVPFQASPGGLSGLL
ncbi:hypothetical protein CHLRE_07g312580v5 [Chlamydomonas reinhardtii]|uniref:Uncharacterized protein n=1 Tax=Chlamydomonas reinhardtii TaxID=3055 RepID=A0A2K3DIG6_CHLRE|nr:uncharacterized protein CHLRE_07g312580v5 [Chlamydomonas reinhardtii]PNW80316.1 hypothetical protein CHLRE_07g312580v5 [Chlamydomonas reinhardtii]